MNTTLPWIRNSRNPLHRFVTTLATLAALGTSFLAGTAQAALTWNLGSGGSWDAATANWIGDATIFVSDGSQDVIFDKTAGGTIVVSSGGMQPKSTTVSAASGTYTFNTGAITGSGGLTKSGGGTLTLSSNLNSYTGKTIIQGGTLVTANAAYLSNAGLPGVFGAPAAGANATIDLHNGVTLQNNGSNPRVNQSTNRALNLAGTGPGTVSIRYNDNDASLTFGAVTATGTGSKLFKIDTGINGNGDREAIIFTGPIADSSDSSPTSLAVTFNTQGSQNWASLSGANSFTGPITLTQINGTANGVLVIGGVRTAGSSSTNTVGTGTLGNGNYPGAISLATRTVLEYDSTTAQTLAGAISGTGAMQVTGSGPLTLSGVNTYTGTTTVNSGCSVVLGSTGGLKFVVVDASSNKVTGAGSATLNGNFTVDTSAVTVISGTWPLVNTTTKSFGASFSLTNFTGPVGNVYTRVIGGQTWTFDKSTGILSLSSKSIITALGITGSAGVINQVNKTITLTVPYGTSLATLAPTFTLTSGTCSPTSGTPPSPNFASSNPATYTVTDGAIVNNYTVTVSITPASSAKNLLTCDFGPLGTAALVGTNFTLSVPPGQQVTALAPTFTLSTFATMSPLSGSTQNFTNPVTYTVTAQDGSTKIYTVTVQSYATWIYSGSLFILTTPDGANLAAGASETNFPLLVRLNSNNFNFTQAASDGSDIRFATAAGVGLSYQIDQWDSANQTAAVWVKIPTITGNARQEIKMYWGKLGVASESSGTAVFNATNGFASVIHLGNTLTDEVGTTSPTSASTTALNGLIGRGRNFASGQGVQCGTSIIGLPSGSGPFSTGVWVRTSTAPTTILGWGVQAGQSKVVMQLASPPHINMDCFFGGANVTGTATIPSSAWTYIVHTFQTTSAKLYVNGVLDASTGGGGMNIPTTSRFDIGGWSGGYDYVGDMDEVRISNVVRSANWVKLEYENQKPLQTVVGSLVQSGTTFSASPPSVTMNEGGTANFTGQAGGAQKVFWILKDNGVDTVLAVDQFALSLPLGRVTGNRSFMIQFKGIYAAGNQTVDIPVTITEAIPDPVFTLTSPATWNGRDTITVTPNIANLAAMQAAGAGTLTYKWTVNGVAVIKTITPGVLTLLRSQGSGTMNVSLTMENGGSPVSVSKSITVQEPATDAWVQRTPVANEKPVNMQFFARDPNTNMGTVYYNGTQSGSPDTVYLKVYKTPSGGSETLDATYRQPLVSGAYAFTAPIAAGLINYRVVYGTTTGGIDTPVGSAVTNLLCGDAFIIEGQSNALATDNAVANDATTDPWIRTYGLSGVWGGAIIKGSEMQLGVWGWYLAKRLTAGNNMPVCIINAAVGGTRIDQHMPNPAGHGTPGSLYSIYANLYNRVVGAKLTHGIRGVMWHQGEQDQGSGGPDGDYDYKFYQQYFVDMTAAWKQDFPNIRNYYVFQIWPGACGDTSRNDQLREVQRSLSSLYSNMRMMSTLGIVPGSGCHYVAAGYQVFSDLMGPLIEQDAYGLFPSSVFTAANLKKAYFTTATQNEIALEFDQNMAWNPGAPGLLFLDGVAGKVTSGSVTGKVIKLQLSTPSTAATITYLKGLVSWLQPNILYGSNGIAALTFADVTISPPPSPYSLWSADPAQGLTAGVNDGALADPDGDGICNLMEFALGGAPMVSSQAILPKLAKPGANWVFEYDRSDLALPPATTQMVEYGDNLTGWTPVTIPTTSAGNVTIAPGTPADHVSVALPDLGSNGFVRLRVSQ